MKNCISVMTDFYFKCEKLKLKILFFPGFIILTTGNFSPLTATATKNYYLLVFSPL